jgi:hypothetical protein
MAAGVVTGGIAYYAFMSEDVHASVQKVRLGS